MDAGGKWETMNQHGVALGPTGSREFMTVYGFDTAMEGHKDYTESKTEESPCIATRSLSTLESVRTGSRSRSRCLGM